MRRTRVVLFLISVLMMALLVGCGSESGTTAGPGGDASLRFSLLWRHQGAWDEHQTIKDGKVYCPMYLENPPCLRVVDLHSGLLEHEIPLNHRCSCAPWFAHGMVYLFSAEYDFKNPALVDPRPTVYGVGTGEWKVVERWPINMFADVEVTTYEEDTDRFYLPSGCYDGTTGRQIWNLGVAFMEQGGALVVDDTVYYHRSKEFRAHSKADGSLLWSLPLAWDDDNKYNTPIFDSDHGFIYIGTDTKPFDDDIISPPWKRSGTVYAIDVQSRSVAWKRHFDNGSIKSVLTYHRGRLFVPLFNNPQGNRLALRWRDGHTLWENAVFGDDGWATSAVDDRYLYTASHGQGAFIVQEQETGDVVWQIEAGPGICCSPIISGGVVVVGTKTDFLAVRVGTGKLVDATWRGNLYFTGYTPQAVEFPEEEKVPWPE